MAWAILSVSLVLTALAWYLSHDYILQKARDRFEFRISETRDAIADRMIHYEQVLRSAVGLFQSSETVSREEWEIYVRNSQLQEYFPGIQGLGVAEFAKPDEKKLLVERIKAEGFPDFEIKPAGERPLYSAIIYLEPFDWRNQRAFGYDMYSNVVRRNAMDRAIQTGNAALSGKVVLVQETDQNAQNGFLVYLPIYQKGVSLDSIDDRMAAAYRLVYAVFRVDDLMAGILPSGVPDIEFEIYDGKEIKNSNLLFDSTQQQHVDLRKNKNQFTGTKELNLQGRTWKIVFDSKASFVAPSESMLSTLVAVGGLIVDVLLFLIIFTIGRQRQAAVSIAEEMTLALSETVEDLTRSNRELDDFAYVASHDLRQPLRNIANLASWVVKDLGNDIPEVGKNNLERLKTQISHMNRLLDDLLEYSRVGRIEEKFSLVDTELLLSSIFESLSKPERFKISAMGDFPTFETLKVPLETCLRNLVSNSIRHHDREDGKVEISVVEFVDFYRFDISDDGPGIDERFHERIFRIFQTLQVKDESIESSGRGIGLAIVKKTTDSYSGKITVESKLGKGTVFHLYWPKVINVRATDKQQP